LTIMGVPLTIEVANLGMADSLILMVMALVVFGPRRLPQIGRQIGKLMYEFRKASNDFKFQMEEELRNAEEADRRKKEEEERQRQLALAPPAAAAETGAPGVIEAGSTESSNSTESSYPYSTYGEVAEAQAQAEATYPSIQPPATGEPVPAAWPGSGTAEAEEAGAAASVEASGETSLVSSAAPAAIQAEIPVEKEAAVNEATVEETRPVTEPAAHNG
jgi:sec-independent protein translocase protein TatB